MSSADLTEIEFEQNSESISFEEESRNLKEKETQTSKTIIQLARLELDKNKVLHTIEETEANKAESEIDDVDSSDEESMQSEPEKKSGFSLTKLFLSKHSQNEKKRSENKIKMTAPVEYKEHDKLPEETSDQLFSVPEWSRFTIKEIRVKSVNASDKLIAQDLKKVSNESISETDNSKEKNSSEGKVRSGTPTSRRRRSLSPPTQHSFVNYAENSADENNSVDSSDSIKSRDFLHILLTKMKSTDWNVALQALVELAERTNTLHYQSVFSHMTEINQRLIEILRSPRSFVSRTGCQIAGKLFENIKDTRRPEFDDIVELLLMKTADSNKFIRKDANCALDSLIMHISPFHSIRVISQKGPTHKNDLVRISTARLFVCIVGIAGVNAFINHSANDSTRQRILLQMAVFIKDKNHKTREYGVRLHKLLREHPNFDFYLKKYFEKGQLSEIKKIIKKTIE